jgi:DHA2 family multidrug resistance protein
VTEEVDSRFDSRMQKIFILLSLTFASALPTLNVTIANAILPQVRGDLSAGLEEISWVLTANLVCTAIAMPTAGWFGMRFGQRRVLLYSIIGFTVASSMLGFAGSLEEVVFWRGVQGLFGGPIPPLCMPILLRSFAKVEHGWVMAVWSGGVMLAPILAPPLGGYLTEIYNWRFAFLFMVPIGFATYFLVLTAISESRPHSDLRLDWVGFIALALSVGSAQFFLDHGHQADWFDSPIVTVSAVISTLAFYVFLVHCITTRQPFVDLRIFLDRNYVIAFSCWCVSGILTFAPLMLIPTLLGRLRDVPVETISIMLTPRGVGFVIGAVAVARLVRIMDTRILLAFGLASQVPAFWYMSTFDLGVGLFEIFVAGSILGLGEAFTWTAVATIGFASLHPSLHGYGAAVFQFGRFFLSSVGISLMVTVLARSTQINHAALVENFTPFNESLRLSNQSGLLDAGVLQGLARIDSEITRQAMMIGYLNDFWLLTVLAAIIVPLVLLLRRKEHQPNNNSEATSHSSEA